MDAFLTGDARRQFAASPDTHERCHAAAAPHTATVAALVKSARRTIQTPRSCGHGEASQRIAAGRDDEVVWPEFANEADADLQW
jgi:hypothetical protein